VFDDMHLSTGDLMQLQNVAPKIVAGSLTDADLAAVVSISGSSSGLTRDPTKLQDTIMQLTVQNHADARTSSITKPTASRTSTI
jgi:hypothetical protein